MIVVIKKDGRWNLGYVEENAGFFNLYKFVGGQKSSLVKLFFFSWMFLSNLIDNINLLSFFKVLDIWIRFGKMIIIIMYSIGLSVVYWGG